MVLDHEYAIINGINRTKVGRYLTLASAFVSGVIVFILLTLVDVAKRLGFPVNLPPVVLSLVGAGTVFAVLYWLFNKYAWRWAVVGLWLRVPVLAGEWKCLGETLKPDGTVAQAWQGDVTIAQSWDKLRIRLKTAQSGSNSISAALARDEIEGCTLLYHYRNDPNIGEPELRAHRGFAELTFSRDLKSATGTYFNGHGRFTFGRMTLTKVA